MQKISKTILSEFFMFKNPIDMYHQMKQLTEPSPKLLFHNFIGTIENVNRESIIVETELFPKDALIFYTKHNMGLISFESEPEQYKKFYNSQRGGGQGDYSFEFQKKFENIVDCLSKFPESKRAVLTMPYAKKLSQDVKHTDDEEQKCVRELHFFVEEDRLHCTGFMRSQARIIFPKNIHFIGTLILDIAERLKLKPGAYTHIITTLVDGRG